MKPTFTLLQCDPLSQEQTNQPAFLLLYKRAVVLALKEQGALSAALCKQCLDALGSPANAHALLQHGQQERCP